MGGLCKFQAAKQAVELHENTYAAAGVVPHIRWHFSCLILQFVLHWDYFLRHRFICVQAASSSRKKSFTGRWLPTNYYATFKYRPLLIFSIAYKDRLLLSSPPLACLLTGFVMCEEQEQT